MAGSQLGVKNPNWRGGRTLASNGYVLVRRPGHPMADCRGYVYEHRLVAAEALGRLLAAVELVHHCNGVKTDNRWANLKVTAGKAAHALEHRHRSDLRVPGEPNPMVACQCGCRAEFLRFDDAGRPRRYVSGHNLKEKADGR